MRRVTAHAHAGNPIPDTMSSTINTTSTASTDSSPNARRGLAAALAAIGAAFLASLCCVGPLVFVAFGVGAGIASTFEPLRPLFTILTVALLSVGFYVVYGKRPVGTTTSAALEGTCAVSRHRTRDKMLLWVATIIAVVFLTFPWWSLLLV